MIIQLVFFVNGKHLYMFDFTLT